MPVVGFKGELKLLEELFTTKQDDDGLIESSVANIDLIPNTSINYMDEEKARKSKGYAIEEIKELYPEMNLREGQVEQEPIFDEQLTESSKKRQRVKTLSNKRK